jgi:Protein of unknown function (DUF2786)
MNNQSLTHLATQSQQIIADRIAQGKKEIIRDARKISGIASEYNARFQREIEDGTRQRQLLLEQHPGEKEEEVLEKYGKFLPSKSTPILNFLYFFINEGYNSERELLREVQDKKYGNLFEDVTHSDAVVAPQPMEQFVYGNCTHATFQTIKKLKRLANSINNENEAAAAYIACQKLCKKYSLEFDKIPG